MKITERQFSKLDKKKVSAREMFALHDGTSRSHIAIAQIITSDFY